MANLYVLRYIGQLPRNTVSFTNELLSRRENRIKLSQPRSQRVQRKNLRRLLLGNVKHCSSGKRSGKDPKDIRTRKEQIDAGGSLHLLGIPTPRRFGTILH